MNRRNRISYYLREMFGFSEIEAHLLTEQYEYLAKEGEAEEFIASKINALVKNSDRINFSRVAIFYEKGMSTTKILNEMINICNAKNKHEYNKLVSRIRNISKEIHDVVGSFERLINEDED